MKPWQKKMWCIPAGESAEFVCAMENVLEVYRRPYDPNCPVVCMDEVSKQLVAETRAPLAPARGRAMRFDYEYERRGTANVFMFTEPLANWRKVSVTDHRTAQDWAVQVRHVMKERYAAAERVTLVMDNLNTHGPASFYEAFSPAEARRLVERIEIVHTPKHGSWLNIAEIENNVLSRQCLSRRIGSIETLRSQIAAWNDERNRNNGRVDWHFSTSDARIKLRRLYPQVQR